MRIAERNRLVPLPLRISTPAPLAEWFTAQHAKWVSRLDAGSNPAKRGIMYTCRISGLGAIQNDPRLPPDAP